MCVYICACMCVPHDDKVAEQWRKNLNAWEPPFSYRIVNLSRKTNIVVADIVAKVCDRQNKYAEKGMIYTSARTLEEKFVVPDFSFLIFNIHPLENKTSKLFCFVVRSIILFYSFVKQI
mgnify:CR=1 FL=1